MKGKYQSALLLPVLVGTLSANFIFFVNIVLNCGVYCEIPDLSKKYSQFNGTLGRICWVTFLKQRLRKSRESSSANN